MRRKKATEPDEAPIELAEPLTAEQGRKLYELRFRGAWPSTRAQGEAVLQRLRSAPGGPDQSGDNAPVPQT